MGQNLFSRHMAKSDAGYGSKHHKENFVANCKTTQNIVFSDDGPPNKRRRVFPGESEEVKQQNGISLRYSVSADQVDKLESRLRSNIRQTRHSLAINYQPPSNSLLENSERENGEHRSVIRSARRVSRKESSCHELRSSKKCPWIKDELMLTEFGNFNPPACPENRLNIAHVSQANNKTNLVEVPSFRRNPVSSDTVKSHSLRGPRINGYCNSVVKAKGRVPDVEDISDEAFARRHKKSEELEKKIVRWDKQRQRELEYYEYLKQRHAQKKTARFAPTLGPVCSAVNSLSSVASPSTKPNSTPAKNGTTHLNGHDRSRVFAMQNPGFSFKEEGTIWPSIENSRSVCAVRKKAGFSLPWTVNPAVVAPQTPSPSKKISPTSNTSLNRATKVANGNSSISQKRVSETKRKSLPRLSSSIPVKRNVSLPGKSTPQLSGGMATRNKQYPNSAVIRRLSLPRRRRSLRFL